MTHTPAYQHSLTAAVAHEHVNDLLRAADASRVAGCLPDEKATPNPPTPAGLVAAHRHAHGRPVPHTSIAPQGTDRDRNREE